MFQINPSRVSQCGLLTHWMGQFFLVFFGIPVLGSQKASGIFQPSWYPECPKETLRTTVSLHTFKEVVCHFTLTYKHFCFMQNYWFRLCKVVPYVSGLCAKKLKKETKQNRDVKGNIVLHCWRDFEHICSSTKSIFYVCTEKQIKH